MDKWARLRGFLDGKEVHPLRLENVYNKFDGYRLDELQIESYTLKSKADCEALINFLEIHKHCFS